MLKYIKYAVQIVNLKIILNYFNKLYLKIYL